MARSRRASCIRVTSDECRRIFDEADEDKDGMLSILEFVNALKAMPEAGQLDDEEATEVFVDVDADEDGLVSWEEFQAVFDEDDEDETRPVSPTEAAAINAAAFESDDD
ncbi:hypothetical protein AB1Y20_018464 [Prymnesium parvum]|uniref:EF-hand domain-containing protein n=1 Tax=Prymnesium parvum TaxID=97485 RepID=A0AB34JR19_PRYPA|mmetsp:Transcript_27372/g.41381  ORF Transcript_27372/g.41381 Transcript_27372/m.41381 type:complete len:109 (+) Transcript_27372:34-360(+)